jgi:hypothetical protein
MISAFNFSLLAVGGSLLAVRNSSLTCSSERRAASRRVSQAATAISAGDYNLM